MNKVREKVRYQGKITSWEDGRGYGFIQSNQGERIFFHISDIALSSRRPVAGLNVSFDVIKDKQGRKKAKNVDLIGLKARTAPAYGHFWLRLVVALVFFAALLASIVAGRLPLQGLFWYAALSVVTIGVYGHDKSAAERQRWRTPEATLHLLALLGGWPGAWLGQSLFRHKCSKAEFMVIFWVTVILNCVGLVAFAKYFTQS